MLPKDPNTDKIEHDPELAALAAYLSAKAPSTEVDPIFREALKEKLLDLAEFIASTAMILDSVPQELLAYLTHEIADFPIEERRALLMEWANHMHLNPNSGALENAFLEVGIQLQDYRCSLPDDLKERRRHIYLLTLAYKRIATLKEALKE